MMYNNVQQYIGAKPAKYTVELEQHYPDIRVALERLAAEIFAKLLATHAAVELTQYDLIKQHLTEAALQGLTIKDDSR